jgi:hypothetical protein
VDEAHLRLLVRDLDADDFQTRQRATSALVNAAEQAKPFLLS